MSLETFAIKKEKTNESIDILTDKNSDEIRFILSEEETALEREVKIHFHQRLLAMIKKSSDSASADKATVVGSEPAQSNEVKNLRDKNKIISKKAKVLTNSKNFISSLYFVLRT